VLVTGASSGIGRAIARELATQASTMVLVARGEERLRQVATDMRVAHPGLEVRVMSTDITNREAVDRLLANVAADVGPVDILVNSAGIVSTTFLEESPVQEVDEMIALNVTALTYLVRKLVPGMIERGRGGILNVGSFYGFTVLPGLAAYVGTKHYVSGLNEALRAELAGTGVVISQVAPGPVKTDFWNLAPNRTGFDFPSFLFVSPELVARSAIRGFGRGKALIVPARRINITLRLIAMTPRPMRRFIWARLGKLMRDNRVKTRT